MPPYSNPLTEDPGLKKLLSDVTNIPHEVEFKRWKDEFLKEFYKFLGKGGMSNADTAFKAFSKEALSLALTVRKMEQFREQGDMTTNKCSVQAKRCLGSFNDRITAVTAVIQKIVPGTQEEEKKVGFTKFHLGAILVRDGFVEYDRLEKIQIHLGGMRRDGLDKIVDSATLASIHAYGDAFDSLCDFLADLGLYQAMQKCTSFIKGEWAPSDEPPVRRRSSESLSTMQQAGQKSKSVEQPSSTSESTAESPTTGRPRGRDRGNPRGNYGTPPRGRAKSAGPGSRSETVGHSDNGKFEFVINSNPDWKGFKKDAPGGSIASDDANRKKIINGRQDPRDRPVVRSDARQRSKSAGPVPRRNVAMEPKLTPKSPNGRKTPLRSRSIDDPAALLGRPVGPRRSGTRPEPIVLSENGKGRPARRNPGDSDIRSVGSVDRGIRRTSSNESDNRSYGPSQGRAGQDDDKRRGKPTTPALALRANTRDNNALVRQRKEAVTASKAKAAGPTPWRQRMQEEKAAQQGVASPNRADMAKRRQSFGGFSAQRDSTPKAPAKASDSNDGSSRARSMTPWRRGREADTGANGARPRRGVSLGRRASPEIQRGRQDDDSSAIGRRIMTPHRNRPSAVGNVGSEDAPTRGRGAPVERRGRSSTPGAAVRQRPDELSKPNAGEATQKPSMKLPRDASKSGENQKPSMKLTREQAKGSSPSNQKQSMKLSRDTARKQLAGKGEKNQEKSPDGKKGPGRKNLGKFFKKKGKDGKAIVAEPEAADAFSIEDSTPGSRNKPVENGARRERTQKSQTPRSTVTSGASNSPTKMFTKKAEFAAPRRSKSLPLQEPDNPFAAPDDDPFASAPDPFADAIDPFADDGNEPNFVGVDESSSSDDDDSSDSEDSGSFFTSSDEDGESDSDEEEDSSDDEGDDESLEDDESDSETEGISREKKNTIQLVVEPVVPPEEAFGDSSVAKGQMPKRKTPQGQPDDDGFCPCCGQGWPNYDRWSKYLE